MTMNWTRPDDYPLPAPPGNAQLVNVVGIKGDRGWSLGYTTDASFTEARRWYDEFFATTGATPSIQEPKFPPNMPVQMVTLMVPGLMVMISKVPLTTNIVLTVMDIPTKPPDV